MNHKPIEIDYVAEDKNKRHTLNKVFSLSHSTVEESNVEERKRE